jgi:broad specificity phosphatase PhoE
MPLDLGVATDFARTQETLELALGERDVPRVVIGSLNEIRFGSYDGGSLEVYRGWAASELPSIVAPGGGESRATAAARFSSGARELLARSEERLLVVAHALVIRYLLDAAEGLVPAARMAPVAHATAHELTRADVERAATLLEERHAGELVAQELTDAQRELGEITGQVTSDELLGRIFQSFCIGK